MTTTRRCETPRGRCHRRLLSLCAAAFGLAAVAAQPAGATVTFGADLSQPADLSFHCNVPPPFFGPYRPPSPYSFPDTCTALTAGNFGGGGTGTLLVPNGSGVITKIRIKEPPSTYDSAAGSMFGPFGPLGQSGPLKVSVLQALRQGQSSAAVCCTVPAESAQFTPAMQPFAETITEFTLTPPLPVHAIVTVTGVYEFEGIAISSVGAAGVIPAGGSNSASSGAYYPAVQPGQERYEQQASLGSADTVSRGTQIMMQADWEPVATPGGATPAPGSPAGAPANPVVSQGPLLNQGPVLSPITLPQRTGQVKGTNAALTLRCNQTAAPCLGQIQLQGPPAGVRSAVKHTTITYGTAGFSIAAGHSRTVKIHLSAAGRKLMRTHRHATVLAIMTVGATRLAPLSVALKR
jgi:hypothetical protein